MNFISFLSKSGFTSFIKMTNRFYFFSMEKNLITQILPLSLKNSARTLILIE